MAPLDSPLSLRHLEQQMIGTIRRHRRILAELGHLIHLTRVRYLVERLEDRAGAKHDEEVDPASVRVHTRRVYQLGVVDVVSVHAAEVFLHDHAGRNQRRRMLKIHRRVDLHAETEGPALTALRFVAVGREPADGQPFRSLDEVAGVRVVLGDLPRAEDADAVRRDDPPPSFSVRPPAEIGLRIHRPGRCLPELVFAGEEPAPRIADRRLEQR